MRIVLDTHVALEAILWQSPRHQLLRERQAQGTLVFLLSNETLEEWRRVLSYPRFELDAELQQQQMDRYCAVAELISPIEVPDTLPRCSDPHDQKFLALSYAANAQMLLTRDKKLRKIARSRKYRERFRTQTPEEFLRACSESENQTSSELV